MSNQFRDRRFWHPALVASSLARERRVQDRMRRNYSSMGRSDTTLPPYPIDMSPLLALAQRMIDQRGIPFETAHAGDRVSYNPVTIAQYALACWNVYLTERDERHRHAFLAQAYWLVEHGVCVADDVSCWPIPFPRREFHAPGPWLSALAQGVGISVLARAYWLTGEEVFLRAARRGVRAFELDILDGGVSTPIGEDGVFFEEVAVYPAAHTLSGFVPAFFGLQDYIALTGDEHVAALLQRSHATMHALIDEYDTGYWTRDDLLHRRLASRYEHGLHVMFMEAFARQSGCEHCAALATRWKQYQRRLICCLRYAIASRLARHHRAFWMRLRSLIGGPPVGNGETSPYRVCIPITAFPVAGGMRSVLFSVMQVMAEEWQIEYLTQHIGPDAEGLAIRSFGGVRAVPWRFPNVFLYVFGGGRKLISLLRHGHRYHLILPQDGVFTGAFAALVARIAGVRVVCMDHGNVTLLYSRVYRRERSEALKVEPWPGRLLSRLRLACYWPALHFLAWIATRAANGFLPAGDDVERVYRQRFNVHLSRIVRYPFMIDTSSFAPFDTVARACWRTQHGIAADTVVIAMVNRLAPEKGLNIAIEGISQALLELPDELRMRVQVIIAGDGPLRAQLEADIRRHKLDATCIIWGEATSADVAEILGASDIFLYTGLRGINSVSVLEAMGAGCAVIASTEPQLMIKLLAEGRGLAIPPGDSGAVAAALVRVIGDPDLRRQMGQKAREYVVAHHNAAALKRALLRATYWPGKIAHGSYMPIGASSTGHSEGDD